MWTLLWTLLWTLVWTLLWTLNIVVNIGVTIGVNIGVNIRDRLNWQEWLRFPLQQLTDVPTTKSIQTAAQFFLPVAPKNCRNATRAQLIGGWSGLAQQWPAHTTVTSVISSPPPSPSISAFLHCSVHCALWVTSRRGSPDYLNMRGQHQIYGDLWSEGWLGMEEILLKLFVKGSWKIYFSSSFCLISKGCLKQFFVFDTTFTAKICWQSSIWRFRFLTIVLKDFQLCTNVCLRKTPFPIWGVYTNTQ